MNGQALVDGVRADARTELDRLGSDKALIAATGAALAADPVLERVALTLDGLRAACEDWAADARDGEGDGAADAAALFAATAEATATEYDRVTGAMEREPTAEPPAVVAALSFEGAPARVGGLVGLSLGFERTLLQGVNFFVNEADERRADLLREVRAATDSRVDEAAAVLDSVCADERDWDAAEAAAVAVIEAAYEEYVDALDALGIDPKPVC